MSTTLKGYWFSALDGLTRGDGRRIAVGKTHKVRGNIKLCERGLHASRRPLDALDAASGNVLWGVELGGTIIEGDTQLVASECTYLWRLDAGPMLCRFARKCALDVVHLWDVPEIVVRYLKRGDESIWGAARTALRDAIWDADDDYVQEAARGAAWGATYCVAWSAALDAAYDAAWAVAGDDDRADTREDVWPAAGDRINRRLVSMIASERRSQLENEG